MSEEEARLALLQTELNNLQSNIRNMDTIVLQIKGWCVTVAIAIAGVAVTQHKPTLLITGEVAIFGFYFINCQFAMFRRGALNRNLAIDAEIKRVGIMQVLKGSGTVEIVGTAIHGGEYVPTGEPIGSWARRNLPDLWFEACRASNFTIYAFLAISLLVELIILL